MLHSVRRSEFRRQPIHPVLTPYRDPFVCHYLTLQVYLRNHLDRVLAWSLTKIIARVRKGR